MSNQQIQTQQTHIHHIQSKRELQTQHAQIYHISSKNNQRLCYLHIATIYHPAIEPTNKRQDRKQLSYFIEKSSTSVLPAHHYSLPLIEYFSFPTINHLTK